MVFGTTAAPVATLAVGIGNVFATLGARSTDCRQVRIASVQDPRERLHSKIEWTFPATIESTPRFELGARQVGAGVAAMSGTFWMLAFFLAWHCGPRVRCGAAFTSDSGYHQPQGRLAAT